MSGGLLLRTYRSIEHSAAAQTFKTHTCTTPRGFDDADGWFGLVTRYADINNSYYVTAWSA
jgi:hypothetical protein